MKFLFFSIFSAVREDRMPGGRNSGAVYNLYKVKFSFFSWNSVEKYFKKTKQTSWLHIYSKTIPCLVWNILNHFSISWDPVAQIWCSLITNQRVLTTHVWTDTLPLGYLVSSELLLSVLIYYMTVLFTVLYLFKEIIQIVRKAYRDDSVNEVYIIFSYQPDLDENSLKVNHPL